MLYNKTGSLVLGKEEDRAMTDVRNLAGKLVCRIDESVRKVEIVSKGHKTLITFMGNGTAEVTHEES